MKHWFIVLIVLLLTGSAYGQQPCPLSFARIGGGTGIENGNSVATDASGNVYVTGSFTGTAKFGDEILVSTGDLDIFVAKYNAAGTLLWARRAGGSNKDVGSGIAVGPGGVYVTGTVRGNNITFANRSLTSLSGSDDIFLAEYDVNGNLNWVFTAGGNGDDQSNGIAIDAAGDVYIAGGYQGTAAFPATFQGQAVSSPTFQLISQGSSDVFVAKFNNATDAFQWGSRASGTGLDQANGVAVDNNGRVYVSGTFGSTTLSFGSISKVSKGSLDIFLAQYSAMNGAFNWAMTSGATGADYGNGVAVDPNGFVYQTGRFQRNGTFEGAGSSSAALASTANSDDIFVTKYDSQGSLIWVKRTGGSGTDFGKAIAADLDGVVVGGAFQNGFVFGTTDLISAGGFDALIFEYDSNGNPVQARRYGSNSASAEVANGIALFQSRIFATGDFAGNVEFVPGQFSSSAGLSDAFLLGFDCLGTPCLLTVNAGLDQTISCAQTATLTGSFSGAQGNVSLSWQRASDGVVISNSASVTVTPSQSASYIFTVTDGAGCTLTDVVVVNVAGTITVNAGNDVVVNPGQSVTLTATGPTNATYVWTASNGFTQAGQSITVTPSSTTTFTVTASSGACSGSDAVVVTVQQGSGCPPGVSIFANGTAVDFPLNICIPGGSVSLTAVPAAQGNHIYRWFRDVTGGDVSDAVVVGDVSNTLVVNQGGFYFVEIVSQVPGCINSRSTSVNVIASVAPVAVISASATNICQGQSINLSAQTVNGATYAWTTGAALGQPGAVLVSNNQVISQAPTAGATTYFLTVSIPNSACPSAVASQTINVGASVGSVVITASGPTTLCSGNSLVLSAPLGNGFTYQWRNGNQNIAGANQSTLLVTNNGSYSVFVSVAGGSCPGVLSNTIGVSFVAAPTANATASATNVCAGTNISLSTPAVAGATYSWTVGGPNGVPFSNARVTNINAQVGFTTYFVTVSLPNSNCPDAISSVSINAAAGPMAQQIMAMGPTTFCSGGSVTLVAPFIANYSYQWRVNGIEIPGANGTSYVVTNGGSYSLAVREIGNNCPAAVSNSIFVEVIEPGFLPIPSTAPSGSATLNYCTGGSLTITTPLVDGYEYTWFFNGDEIPNSNSNVYVATQAGVYHVMVSIGGGCTRRKSEGLFVTPEYQPFSFITKYDAQICPQSNVKIGVHVFRGDLEYQDGYTVTINPPYLQLLDSTYTAAKDTLKMLVLAKPLQTTTYTITVKDVNGCERSQQITIFVGDIQAPEISGPACLNEYPAYTLVNATEETYSYYQWRRRPLGSTGEFTVNNSTVVSGQNTPTLTPAGAGLYRLYVSNPGCPIVASNVITILASPTVVGTDRTICQTTSTTLLASGAANVSGALTYQWFNPFGQEVFTGAGPHTVSVANGQLGIGLNEFTVMVTNANNCTAMDVVAVNVANTIGTGSLAIYGNGALDADFSICPGGSIELSTDFIDGVTYTWRLNGSVIAGSNSPTITATAGGSYQVTISNTCGSRSGSRTVTVRTVPTITIPSVAPICYGGSRQLSATISLAGVSTNNIPFEWTPGDGSLSDYLVRNPIASPMVTTTYTLTATNPNNGCTSSRSVTVVVDENLGPIARSTTETPMLCVGSSAVLRFFNDGNLGATTGNPDGASDVIYRWDRLTENGPVLIETGSLPNATISNITVTPNASATYVLTLTDPDIECVSTCYIHITVGMLPVATVQPIGSLNLCDGPLELRSISNAANNVTYQWYVDATNLGDWVAIPGATNINYFPQTGGTYTVRVTDVVNPACWDYANNPVTAIGVRNGAQDPAVISARQNGEWAMPTASVVYCSNTEGNGVRLRANYIFNTSYQWYRNGVEIAGANDVTLDVYTPGNYQVKLTTCSNNSFPCDDCVAMSKICSVLQIPTPKPLINHVSTVVLCNGESVELYTQNMSSIYSYQWQRNNLGTWVDVAGATNYNFFTNQEGEYRVVVTVKWDMIDATSSFIADKCSAVSINTVVVSNEFGVTISKVAGDGNSTCTGNVTQLKAVVASEVNVNGYTWFRLGANGVETQVGVGQVLTLTGPGTYFVRISPTNVALENCQGVNSAPVLVDGVGFTLSLGTVDANRCLANGNFSLSATVNTLDPVSFEWTGENGSDVALLSDAFSATPIFDVTAAGEGTFTYTVTATDLATSCSSAQTVSFTLTDCAAISCETPSNVNPEAQGEDVIVVSWDLSLDTEVQGGYRVSYASTTAPDVVLDQIDTDVSTNTVTFTNVPVGQYIVSVYSICRTSPLVLSDPVEISGINLPTGAQPVIGCNAAPNGLAITNVTSTTATATWNAVQGTIVNYQLRYRVAGTTTWQVQTSTTNSTVLTGLIPNTQYEYRLRTNCGTGSTPATSPLTNLATFTTTNGSISDCSQPPVITSVNAGCVDAFNNTTATVNWIEIPQATQYRVEWRVNTTGTAWQWSEVDAPANSLQIQFLAPGTTYRLRVRATCPSGNTAYSTNPSTFTTGTTACASGRLGGTTADEAVSYAVYPNPNKGTFSVSIDAPGTGIVRLNLTDLTGRTVYTQEHDIEAGMNNLPVQLDGTISKGIYMLQLNHNGNTKTVKVVVE